MKVLQINSVCGIGSTGRIATDIHNILLEQGHESYIGYGRNLSKNCDSTIKIGTKLDNYVHVAKTRVLDKHGFGSKKATVKFIEKVRELDPDIIHLHNIHGYYINIELLFNYLRKSDKPIVWTLHDCWAFTGHCAYFDYVSCNKWKSGCTNCPEKKSYPSSVIFDNSKENYAKKKDVFTGIKNLTLVTPSKWLADIVKESFLNEYDVEVINNGIDLDVFKPTLSDFKKKYNIEDKFVILGVASIWDRRKGIEYFYELSKRISHDVSIVLVGLTEKQKENLPKNIIGISKTNNINELAAIYTAADIFVNPTLEDNFPTTNLEALACGTPVITFNTGGSIESVDVNCGKVVNKGDLDSLVKAIQESKYLNREMCKQKALEFDKSINFIKYIDLYINVNNQ